MDFDIEVPENNPKSNENQQQPKTEGQDAPSDNAIDLPELELGQADSGPTYVVEPDQKKLAVKFGIIGAGQGGSRLADTFYQIGYRRVCAINTTEQDFLGLTLPVKRQKVMKESEGGAGKDTSKGELALQSSSEDVMNLMRHSFGEDIDRIVVCIGAGGGTGTGSAMGLVRLARQYLRLLGKEPKVGMIISLPKHIEGGKVQANAAELLSHLSPMAQRQELSPFILTDNESINRMFPNVSAKKFWATANKNTVGLFDIFNVLAAQRSAYVTFDKADYQNMLDSGIIIFGATKLDSYNHDTDLSDGLRNNLKRTLLADVDITTASHVAGILAAPDRILEVLPQSHIDMAFSTLERLLGGETKNLTVHQGVYEASASKNSLYLYTMVGGLTMPEKRIEQMRVRAGVE